MKKKFYNSFSHHIFFMFLCVCLNLLTVVVTQLFFLQTVPMMPLNRLAPRLRRSVEGLSLELEEVFVSEKPDDQHEVRKLIYAFENQWKFTAF